MTEEEAIEWAKALLQDKEKYAKYHSWVGTNTFVSIQILLNLIENKENQQYLKQILINERALKFIQNLESLDGEQLYELEKILKGE